MNFMRGGRIGADILVFPSSSSLDRLGEKAMPIRNPLFAAVFSSLAGTVDHNLNYFCSPVHISVC